MKLVALTFTRIDGDVIEEFLRHTARFVDHHYLGILGASDNALEIAQALTAEGLPITIWRLSNSVSLEGDPRMTSPFARLAYKEQKFDYLLPIDADEFIVAQDRDHLERALSVLPPQAHAEVYWTTYVPALSDDASEPRLLARIQNRRTSEAHPYAKVFINRSLMDDPSAVITVGNHMVTGTQAETISLPDIRLAHFPVRSLLQIQSKALLGTSAILMAGGEKAALGYQWQLAYRRLFESGEDATSRDLCELAANYLGASEADWHTPDFLVHDPLPTVSREYAAETHSLLELSLGLAFQTAQAYGGLRNAIMPPPLNPAAQWPDHNAALGTLDAIAITDSGLDLELEGWIAIPDSDVSISGVFAIFPGKKIALACDLTASERARFRGSVGLEGFEDGIYLLRVFAIGDDARWFVLSQTVVFEKREGASALIL